MSEKTQDQAVVRQRLMQLGEKFVRRTVTELDAMSELVERIQGGDAAAIHELELLAHKIHGTGATFGFTSISASAGEIERVANQAATTTFDAASARQVAASMARLRSELELIAPAPGG